MKRIAENFPNMGKEIVNQVQETQRVPGSINPKRNTPRHILIKLSKIRDKDKILKSTGEYLTHLCFHLHLIKPTKAERTLREKQSWTM